MLPLFWSLVRYATFAMQSVIANDTENSRRNTHDSSAFVRLVDVPDRNKFRICNAYCAITNASDDLTSVTRMKYISIYRQTHTRTHSLRSIHTKKLDGEQILKWDKLRKKPTRPFAFVCTSPLICIRCSQPLNQSPQQQKNAKLIKKKHAVV